MSIEMLRERLPDAARDIALNLSGVLGESSLTTDQKWGVALATAYASRNAEVAAAVKADALAAGVAEAVFEDAKVAAVLMAMNNVYYRFRHFVEKPSYGEKPARLRMTKLAKPATSKADLELFCLAVSAVNGCQTCVAAHERVVTGAGLGEEQVHDAVRVAAVIHAAAVSLELAGL